MRIVMCVVGKPLLLAALLLAFAASTPGCGGSTATSDAEESEFRMLTLAYVQLVRANDGQPPEDIEEFKEHVSESLSDYMESEGRSLEQLFISPRDSQPYVFFTQKNQPPAGTDVIGHEQSGANGRRYVGDSSGSVFEADEAVFRKLVPSET